MPDLPPRQEAKVSEFSNLIEYAWRAKLARIRREAAQRADSLPANPKPAAAGAESGVRGRSPAPARKSDDGLHRAIARAQRPFNPISLVMETE